MGDCAAEQMEWEGNFQELVAHFNATRSTLPPNWMDSATHRRKGLAPPPKGTLLRAWIDSQRQLYRHGELDIKRQQRLQDTGLQLTLKGKLREVDWETMVGRLKSFHMLHGHCRVHEFEGEELLEQWVQVQQLKEMRGTLSHEKQALLNSLGISWQSSWLESWKQLCLLKQHHGKIRVLALKHSKRHFPLYIWLRNQRLMQMEGSLDKGRVKMLEQLGCRWQGMEHADSGMLLGSSLLDRYLVWEPRFNFLVLFKQMHGHCDMHSLLLAQEPSPADGRQDAAGDLGGGAGNWTLKQSVSRGGGGAAAGERAGVGESLLARPGEALLARLGPGRPRKKIRAQMLENLQNMRNMQSSARQTGRLALDFPFVALWLQVLSLWCVAVAVAVALGAKAQEQESVRAVQNAHVLARGGE